MTGHIGTNTPKFVPPRWGRLRSLALLKRGCANSGVGCSKLEPFCGTKFGYSIIWRILAKTWLILAEAWRILAELQSGN